MHVLFYGIEVNFGNSTWGAEQTSTFCTNQSLAKEPDVQEQKSAQKNETKKIDKYINEGTNERTNEQTE